MSAPAITTPTTAAVRLDAVLVFALGAVVAAGPAADRGGYFAGTWSWLVLGVSFLATVRLLVLPETSLRRLDIGLLAALAAFTGWVALSAAWAPALTPVLNETTRALAYLAVVLLALLVVRRHTVEPLLLGVLAGITAVAAYALATRLVPDRVGSWDPATGFRLADPIGYWNGLGIYAAMGAALAVGIALRSSSRLVRAFAGAAPPVLLATVLFTFSRGAWLALAIGLVAAFALDPRRLQLVAGVLVLAPWSAIVLLAATRSDTLTDQAATLPQVIADGDGFARLVVAMAVASALAALAFGELCDRVETPTPVRKGFAAALVVLALVGVGVLWSAEGAPWSAADRAWERFTAPPKATGTDATERLFDLSGSYRVELWRVSRQGFEQHRVAGTGAGSFASEWFRTRDIGLYSREGHSLYAETLGELGVTGLALLGLALLVPLVAAVRCRREPMVAGALALYVAFLVHAGVDWDWELAGVTLPALLAGAALVVLARSPAARARPLPPLARIGLPVLTGALAVAGVFLVLGNVSTDRARVANREGRWAQALAEADRAVRWAPWSSSALHERAKAELGLARVAAARADLRAAIDRTPNEHELWVDYASALEGQPALDAIERAIALNPRDPRLLEQRDLYRRRAAAG